MKYLYAFISAWKMLFGFVFFIGLAAYFYSTAQVEDKQRPQLSELQTITAKISSFKEESHKSSRRMRSKTHFLVGTQTGDTTERQWQIDADNWGDIYKEIVGKPVKLKIDPNSNTVYEITQGDKTLLSYQSTVDDQKHSQWIALGLLVFGLVMLWLGVREFKAALRNVD